VCWTCGEKGHLATSCPKKKDTKKDESASFAYALSALGTPSDPETIDPKTIDPEPITARFVVGEDEHPRMLTALSFIGDSLRDDTDLELLPSEAFDSATADLEALAQRRVASYYKDLQGAGVTP